MTRSRALAVALSLAAAALIAPRRAVATDPDTASMQRVFTAMRTALQDAQEPPFKAQWDPRGYARNLVGGSGLAGAEVFRQGSRKRWHLKPQMNKLRTLPGSRDGPWIIPCEVWSWDKQRAVDAIFALLVYEQKRWRMLGGGERLEEVVALGQRYVAKKDLAPPPRGR